MNFKHSGTTNHHLTHILVHTNIIRHNVAHGIGVICTGIHVVPPKKLKINDQNPFENQRKRRHPAHVMVQPGEDRRVLPANHLLVSMASLKGVIQSVQNDNVLCCQVPIIFIIFLITRKFCTIQTSNIEYLSRYQIMKNYLL